MGKGSLSRARVLFRKAVEAIPEVILHPQQVVQAAQGAHWATLNMLDQPWLKALDVRTVVDVGANAGQFASAARVVFPSARVYSFEPLPDVYRKLSDRFEGDSQFRAFNVAVGDRNGIVSINRNSFSESSSLLSMSGEHLEAFPWAQATSVEQVEIRTLDSYLSEIELDSRVLLKIDVQGLEDRVLQGGKRIVELCDVALVETSFSALYDNEATFRDIYEVMNSLGMEFRGLLDQLLHPVTNSMLQGDAVFIRRRGDSNG